MIDQNVALLPNGLPQARARLGVGQGIAIAVGLVISVAGSFSNAVSVSEKAEWIAAANAALDAP